MDTKTVLATAMLWIASLTTAYGELVPLNKIVAVVDQEVITQQMLDARRENIVKRIEESGQPTPPEPEFTNQILDLLITETLQLQMAESQGIFVSELQVDEAIENLAQQNGLSTDEFISMVNDSGYAYRYFRENIRDEITIRQLQQRSLANSIYVSPGEIKQAQQQYELNRAQNVSYRLGHILIALPANPTAQQVQAAEEKVAMINRALEEGESFQSLAIQYSNAGTNMQGGDLGFRRLNEIPTLFQEITPNLNTGEIAEPIRNSSGYHIVTMLEINDGLPDLKEIKTRHILIRDVNGRNTQSLLAEINNLIQQGEDFGSLARLYSEDTASAAQDGEIGWTMPGNLVPEYELAAYSLDVGEISPPVKSDFGWHIILLEDVRILDNHKDFLEQQLATQLRELRFQEELQTWLVQLKDQATIEIKTDS